MTWGYFNNTQHGNNGIEICTKFRMYKMWHQGCPHSLLLWHAPVGLLWLKMINFSFTWWTIHLTLGISSYYRLEVARCWILHYGLPLPRPLIVFEVGALFALFEFFLDASGYSAEKLRSKTAPFSEKSLLHTLILHNYRKFEMCSAYMRWYTGADPGWGLQPPVS